MLPQQLVLLAFIMENIIDTNILLIISEYGCMDICMDIKEVINRKEGNNNVTVYMWFIWYIYVSGKLNE